MAYILALPQGTSRDFQLQIVNRDGSPATGLYQNTDALATTVWLGQSETSVLTPTTTWISAAAGTVQISFNNADTVGLNFWAYPVLTTATRAGRSAPVYEGLLQVDPAPGSGVALTTYCSTLDMQLYVPQIRKLQDDKADLAGFSGQRNRARTRFEEFVKDRYRPQYGRSKRYLTADGTAAGPFLTYCVTGPTGQAAPTPANLQAYFDQGGLKPTKLIVEANARLACAYVLGAQPGRENPYAQQAAAESAIAMRLMNDAVVDLDVASPPTGSYTVRVDRDVTWLT